MLLFLFFCVSCAQLSRDEVFQLLDTSVTVDDATFNSTLRVCVNKTSSKDRCFYDASGFAADMDQSVLRSAYLFCFMSVLLTDYNLCGSPMSRFRVSVRKLEDAMVDLSRAMPALNLEWQTGLTSSIIFNCRREIRFLNSSSFRQNCACDDLANEIIGNRTARINELLMSAQRAYFLLWPANLTLPT
jgi:hypothetical protein